MKRRTLALVESPAQTLNVIEWAAASDALGSTRLMVLPPREPTTRLQLSRMVEVARAAGLAATWLEPRRSAASMVAAVWDMFPRLAKAERLVIGDPFSRLVQAVLPLCDLPECVIVDDGTATIAFVDQWVSGGRLTRWHAGASSGVVDGWLAQHTRDYLTEGLAGRRVELFTAMPVEAPADFTQRRNDFAWTRDTFGPPQVTDQVDLIGTSLVETGVVSQAAYLDGVAQLVGATPGRYFAHRREDDAKLRAIGRRTGLAVVRPALPLELVAARGPIGDRLVSFPSTVIHTVPLILEGTGATLRVMNIPPAWYRADAPKAASGFLGRVLRTTG